MKKMLAKTKRALAVLLSSAVILTSVPQSSIAVYAAMPDETIAAENEAAADENVTGVSLPDENAAEDIDRSENTQENEEISDIVGSDTDNTSPDTDEEDAYNSEAGLTKEASENADDNEAGLNEETADSEPEEAPKTEDESLVEDSESEAEASEELSSDEATLDEAANTVDVQFRFSLSVAPGGLSTEKFVSKLEYASNDGELTAYEGEIDHENGITVPVTLDENGEGKLRFKLTISDDYKLEEVEKSYGTTINPDDSGVYEISVNEYDSISVDIYASKYYTFKFNVDDNITLRQVNDDVLTEIPDNTIKKTYNDIEYNEFTFNVTPADGYRIGSVQANSAGISVKSRGSSNSRNYSIGITNKKGTVREVTTIFISAEPILEHTLTFNYPEDKIDLTVKSGSETIALNNKQAVVKDDQSISCTAEVKDITKALSIKYENDDISYTMTTEDVSVEEIDSDEDGTSDTVRYEFDFDSLEMESDTTVTLSLIDYVDVTFQLSKETYELFRVAGSDAASYDLNMNLQTERPYWNEYTFTAPEGTETLPSLTIQIPQGEKLLFLYWTDKYSNYIKSAVVGDKELPYTYDPELGEYYYSLTPTEDTTVLLSMQLKKFRFVYDKSEVEDILIYNEDNMETPLTLSEDNEINCGDDKYLTLKIKPKEGYRLTASYIEAYDHEDEYETGHTEFVEWSDEPDEEGYYQGYLETANVDDYTLTIKCYERCPLTFNFTNEDSKAISVTELYKCYNDDNEVYWDYSDNIVSSEYEDKTLTVDKNKDFYFTIDTYDSDVYKQSCTITADGTVEQPEVCGYTDENEPIYHIIPTENMVINVSRETLKTFTVTIVKDEHIKDYGASLSNGAAAVGSDTGQYSVRENLSFILSSIDKDSGYRPVVTYTVNGKADQLVGAEYDSAGDICYPVKIIGDTTINIKAEAVKQCKVTVANADKLNNIKIWEVGKYSEASDYQLQNGSITLDNSKKYCISFETNDDVILDSLVCTDATGAETVIEPIYDYDNDISYYPVGAGYELSGDLTIEARLVDGYTLCFDIDESTGTYVYSYSEKNEDGDNLNITGRTLKIPADESYSFYIEDSDSVDLELDNESFTLTDAITLRYDEEIRVYTVTPKSGADLSKRATVRIKEIENASHIISLDYPETVRSAYIGYCDYANTITYLRATDNTVKAIQKPLILDVTPINGYDAVVTINTKDGDAANAKTLTPFRNESGTYQYYLGVIDEDKSIVITTEKSGAKASYYMVGFVTQRASVFESEHGTPYTEEDIEYFYDSYDPDGYHETVDTEYLYYVKRGDSVSFYAEPYFGYKISAVYAGTTLLSPTYDESLGKDVYTYTPAKRTLFIIQTVPDEPDEPDTPDDPTEKYNVTFNYDETVKSLTFKDASYTLEDKKLTVAKDSSILFKVEPADGYKLVSVKAGDNTLTADADGYYSLTVSADIQITVTTEKTTTDPDDPDTPDDPTEKYNVTFNYDETVKSLTFKDASYTLEDKKLTVAKDSSILFKVEPADGYKLVSVTAGDNTLTADADGYYSFTVSADIQITVTTEKTTTDPDDPSNPDDPDDPTDPDDPDTPDVPIDPKATYVEKITLQKKTTKVYTGQQNVCAADVAYSPSNAEKGTGLTIVDNSASEDAAVTCTEENGKLYISAGKNTLPGKHTLQITAFAPSELQPASTTLTVTVLKGIEDLSVDVPATRIYKQNGKAASMKAVITYNKGTDAPKVRKIKEEVVKANDNVTFPNVTVKNGKITVNKNFTVSSDESGNQFKIHVTAADYEGNTTEAYSDVITITNEPLDINGIYIMQKNPEGRYAVTVKDASEVTSDKLKDAIVVAVMKKGSAEGSETAAFDPESAYSEEELKEYVIDPSLLTYKSSNKALSVGEDGTLKLTKYANKIKLTLQTDDGGKKKKTMQFKVKYAAPAELQLAIRDENGEQINGTASEASVKTASFAGTENTVITLNVQEKGTDDKWQDLMACAKHTVKVKGGKILKSDTAAGIYEISVTSGKATVTLTDKTKSGIAPKVYEITNTAYNGDKAPSAKAAYYNNSALAASSLAAGSLENRKVIITLKGSSAGNFKSARLEIDRSASAKLKEGSAQYNAYTALEASMLGAAASSDNVIPVENSKISVSFDNGNIPAGSYKLKLTLSKSAAGSGFKPDAKQVKITLKVAKPKAIKGSFKVKTSYSLKAGNGYKADISYTAKNLLKDSEGRDRYTVKLVNANVGGKANAFLDYFELDETNGQYTVKLKDDKKDKISELKTSGGKKNLTGYIVYTAEYGDDGYGRPYEASGVVKVKISVK